MLQLLLVSHVGVDADHIKEVGASVETRALVQQLQKSYKDKIVLFGIASLDYIKGIPLKLKVRRAPSATTFNF